MRSTTHNGSRRDVLLLLDSPGYLAALNSALAGTETVVSASDVHRPLGLDDDREYELPKYCREYTDSQFDLKQIEEPLWWIVKHTRFVQTPNFDLISSASICDKSGILLVEAKAHYVELETCGKSLKSYSSVENHTKIGECIDQANRALNEVSPGFHLSRDSFYQISNRVSWGWRLAALGVPVTLLYLGFVKDPYWRTDQFRSPEEWLEAARKYLANVVPVDVIGQRLRCSEKGSLLITAASLPATPTQ